MMKIVYEIIEEEKYNECEEKYTTYGVKHIPTDCSISDITMNRDKLYEFVKQINKFDLEEIHFMDVVEDFLAELQ